MTDAKSILQQTTDSSNLSWLQRNVNQDEEYLEDGPLFRATIKELEGRTSTLKTYLKRLIKTTTASLEAKQAWLAADEAFIQSLRDTPAAEPLWSAYLEDTWATMLSERERLQHSMQSLLVDPLAKLYEMDIKVAETKKRQFEEESKEYYAFLTKYMGIQKNSTSASDTRLAETKYLFKKRRFDLVRFDYYSFLIDLHGGKKEQEVLFHLLSYHQKEHTFYKTMAGNMDQHQSGLNDLSNIMAEISKSQQQISKERIEKRKWLESKYTDDITVDTNDLPPNSSESTNSASDECDKFHGIRDLEQQDRRYSDLTERRKEGFLFSTSKPLKPNSAEVSSGIAWHKYWCVLSGGKLHEYSNWKKLIESHIDPINLRFATVREARNAERRFSFEVITPHIRRIYQATSQDEMLSWINTIQNAIEGLLNGTGTTLDLPSEIDQNIINEKDINIESLLDAASLPPTPIPSKSKSKSRLRKSVASASPDVGSVSMKKSSSHRKSFSGALRSVASGIHSYDKISLKKQPSTNDLSSLALNDDDDSIPIPPLPTTQQYLISPPSNDNGSIYSNNNSNAKSSNEKFRWSLLSNYSVSKDNEIYNNGKIPTIVNGQYVFTPMTSNNNVVDIIRSDPANHFCADCNEKNPDWCSLNLGIFLCIECSGIHRSLGTHISKVRSLTLDNSSYSPDILALLQSIGNEKSNQIWEATLSTNNSTITKVSSSDRRDKKLQYIQEKYVVRSFIEPPTNSDEKSDANLCLFKAIDNDDIPAALRAIVLGASVNSSYKIDILKSISNDIDDGQHQEFIYALHLALLKDRDSQLNDIDKNDELDDTHSIYDNNSKINMVAHKKQLFPMAEFLFQNGADAGIVDSSSGKTVCELIGMDGLEVSDNAIEYLNIKNTARGQSLIYRSSLPPPVIKK